MNGTVPIELLDALGARPDDDATRSVVGDLLLDAGDPRGEFITLTQRARAGSLPAPSKKRLVKLFNRHREAWVGPLARVPPHVELRPGALENVDLHFGASVWDRGFPVFASGCFTGSTAGRPEWLTVREVTLYPPVDRAMPRELAAPSSKHLRRVVIDEFFFAPYNPRADDTSPYLTALREWAQAVRAYLHGLGRSELLEGPPSRRSRWQWY
jgi:uncharacterized protein (TIGR02996 family)